jgi:hypothetical protein
MTGADQIPGYMSALALKRMLVVIGSRHVLLERGG